MPLALRRLNSATPDFARDLKAAIYWDAATERQIQQQVEQIIERVRFEGDTALIDYCQQFDGFQVSTPAALEISASELQQAWASLAPSVQQALEQAAQRIRHFHEVQLTHLQGFEFTEADGTRLGQLVRPLARVGLYVPGGKAAYPSSVLMNAIPAKVAGVEQLIMVVPTPKGVRNPTVLGAAALAGVDRVFTLGGAQAVAALAYGTATIPAVDKIVGPGNAYVASAKRQVFGQVGIDMIAGPSEILVIADGSVPPEWIAYDLFSQAEHDELAQAILISPDAAYLDAVLLAMTQAIAAQPRAATIRAALAHRGLMIQCRDLQEACTIANQIAPEHLEIATHDPAQWVEQLQHAGALFLGGYSSEALGDYCAGPNHVLPTAGTARFSSPLGVYDFQKRSSVIEISKKGAQTLGKIADTLGQLEGLSAHATSARLRIDPTAAA